MNKTHRFAEKAFEKVNSIAVSILGSSVTFTLAVCTVIFWFSNERFYSQDIHYSIGDLILGTTFLSLFIIQKSFNRFSASIHLKVNELVASHEPASNAMINLENKSESELNKLSREYAELSDKEKTE